MRLESRDDFTERHPCILPLWLDFKYSYPMFTGSGTLINIITIVTGASLGVLIGGRMPERMRALITDVLGLITILGALTALVSINSDRYVDALPKGWPLLAILASLLIGGVIGSAANLENRLEGFGNFLRVKFRADGQGTLLKDSYLRRFSL